jgi:CRISPR system Cascade subunit CasC
MSRFIQIHALTIYAPSNLNRDDTGRPKTAKFGGAERLRISSQALKRAIRTSDAFRARLAGHIGQRTAKIGDVLLAELTRCGIAQDKATAIARTLTALVGTLDVEKADQGIVSKELFFISPAERLSLSSMCEAVRDDAALADELLAAAGAVDSDEDEDGDEDSPKKKGKKKGFPKKKLAELRERVLITSSTAADIAMFGRMVASSQKHNFEAAVQVAHAITTHRVEVEDDFYTAVDDLKKPSKDAGAGFIGELGFGSGVFYIYTCVDRALLLKNLGGNTQLAEQALAGLIEGLATASPTGKQASFASRSRASHLRIEKGSQQPRSLAAAFFKPLRGDDLLATSVAELARLADGMTKAYGPCFDGTAYTMDVASGTGSLAEAITFASAEGNA